MNENYDNFKSYFTNEDEFNSWDEIVKDILNNEEFKKRVCFKHHEKQSLYTHSDARCFVATVRALKADRAMIFHLKS